MTEPPIGSQARALRPATGNKSCIFSDGPLLPPPVEEVGTRQGPHFLLSQVQTASSRNPIIGIVWGHFICADIRAPLCLLLRTAPSVPLVG